MVNLRPRVAAGDAMKRISTRFAFAFKLFPFIFFGFLIFFLALLVANGALQKAPLFLVFPIVITVGGYQYWKTKVHDLVDEVDDCGDYLLVKKNGEEDTVMFSNISDVRFSLGRRGTSPRITLNLSAPGKFGTVVTFAPPPKLYLSSPSRNEIADDLNARAYKARQSAGTAF